MMRHIWARIVLALAVLAVLPAGLGAESSAKGTERPRAAYVKTPVIKSLPLRPSARLTAVKAAATDRRASPRQRLSDLRGRREQGRMIALVSRIALLKAELAEIDRELAGRPAERALRDLKARKRAALSRLSGLSGRLTAAKRAMRPGGKR